MRIKRLDILRCAAVLLVLFHHTAVLPSISQMGFVGVDLFFVLSGFLISGLLYKEYHKRGSISFPRFFIRRGLKIYPAFYVMLLVTFIVQLAAGKLSGWGAYLRGFCGPLFLFDLFVARHLRGVHGSGYGEVSAPRADRVPAPGLVFVRLRALRDRDGQAHRISCSRAA